MAISSALYPLLIYSIKKYLLSVGSNYPGLLFNSLANFLA
nr:MAG TPA: hypothetical protein [Crassvirales sp.]